MPLHLKLDRIYHEAPLKNAPPPSRRVLEEPSVQSTYARCQLVRRWEERSVLKLS